MSVVLRIAVGASGHDGPLDERRFGLDSTVASLKVRSSPYADLTRQDRLLPITGIPAHAQALSLDGAPLSDHQTLAQLGAYDGQLLGVVSTDASVTARLAQLDDDPNVDKFELSKEEYEARPDTVLAYKQRNKMGRFAPTDPSAAPAEPPADELPRVGERCEISPGARRGVVRFLGPTDFARGHFVGVELDEPLGNGDGTVNGRAYFATGPKRAAFVKPEAVQSGPQYGERDALADLDEDEEMEI